MKGKEMEIKQRFYPSSIQPPGLHKSLGDEGIDLKFNRQSSIPGSNEFCDPFIIC